MLAKIESLFELLLSVIYPHYCCNCGSFGRYVCKDCQYLVDFHFVPIKVREGSALSSVHAAFTMSGPISNMIHFMKYKYVKGIAKTFGKLLYLHSNFPDAEVVTFVPISVEKRRVRGFNQAEVIAQSFAQLTHFPCQQLLIRTDQTLHGQAKISNKQERVQTTQHHNFYWQPTARAPTSVLLIDDVYTTGTTLETCAQILKTHGVSQVHGLVIAHGK